jgi:hypothetical protein
MLQGLRNLFRRIPFIPPIPAFKENVLLIQAFPRKKTLTVTYKGHTQHVYFEKQVIRNMLAGRRFEKHTETFVSAIAQSIKQLIQ